MVGAASKNDINRFSADLGKRNPYRRFRAQRIIAGRQLTAGSGSGRWTMHLLRPEAFAS